MSKHSFPRQMLLFSCLLLSFIPLIVNARSALSDNPFQGNEVVYLSGTGAGSWIAWTNGPVAERKCKFIDNVDFDTSSVTGKTTVKQNGPVTSKESCCIACYETVECAASVFNIETSECWLKNQTQLQKKVARDGRIACIKEIPPSSKANIYPTKPPKGSLQIPATVPGDLITDLENSGQIDDPLYEMNFLNNSLWTDNIWTYSTTFLASKSYTGKYVLVFDGIKMGARVAVNGVEIGNATDQFLRYRFPLSLDVLSRSTNDKHVLTVRFETSLKCAGRWMACTGGWDWAPYSHTVQEGANTFSKGIWKDVYIVKVDPGAAAIEHFVPHTFYKGVYPTSALASGNHADFEVHMTVHLWAPDESKGSVVFRNGWGSPPCSVPDVLVPKSGATMVNCSTRVTASQISLWWPNNVGEGKQPLYDVSVDYMPSEESESSSTISTSRRIGFRTFAIVTGKDESPGYVNASVGKEGTENNGMFFRVNGAAVFARGANMIPMEELEGRMTSIALRSLVQSAASAGFNILRNWGGGIFLPDIWYDTCDELGIMIYHDMMFAQRGHSPQVTKTEEKEFRHQARRLSHHSSIVVWDGCNECRVDMKGPTSIYATFLLTTIAEEDRMRSVWPACPAAGWKSGVDRLTSRPTGTSLETQYLTVMETHGPYQHGTLSDFPSTDVGAFNYSDNPAPTIITKTTAMGTQEKNIFASEFGSVVMSSFESMSATLDPKHWALHGGSPYKRCEIWPCDGANPMAERNYECTPLIRKWFGDIAAESLNITGESSFKQQLYQCMVGQALEMKSNIEHRRSTNVFGIIVWQYNEIWPTGGWGSIEYGTAGKAGQVVGGRWKPLHYFYESHLYRDIIAVCSRTSCYVKNDGNTELQNGRLILESIDLQKESDNTDILLERKLTLESGPGIIQHFNADFAKLNFSSQVVSAKVLDGAGHILSSNLLTLAYPKLLSAPTYSVTASVVKPTSVNPREYDIEIKASGPALYVVLTSSAHGRFSENCFYISGKGSRMVKFISFIEEDQYKELDKSLRVEHLGEMLRA